MRILIDQKCSLNCKQSNTIISTIIVVSRLMSIDDATNFLRRKFAYRRRRYANLSRRKFFHLKDVWKSLSASLMQ
jgi:hypothetical protein